MDWGLLIVAALIGSFILWQRSKAQEAAKSANARLDRDTCLYDHIKAGKREYDWRKGDENFFGAKHGELLFETAHLAAYHVSHFAEFRLGFYFKDIEEYGLYGFFAGEPVNISTITTAPIAPSKRRGGC